MEHPAKKKRSRILRARTGEGDNKLHINSPVATTKSTNEKQSNTRSVDSKHQRNLSLHVSWTLEDVKQIAREIYDETVADVHLSLLAYWIQEKSENYNLAKEHIRELSLDQVRIEYCVILDAFQKLTWTCRGTTSTGLGT